MRIHFRSCAAVSILLVSLLSACGKKEEPAPAAAPVSESAAPEAVEPPAPPAPVKAPEPVVAAVEKSFFGTIGGQPVVMQLSFQDEASSGRSIVKGSYFVESQGSSSKQPVSGTLQDGKLVMEQSVGETVTGNFNLKNDPADKSVYLGSWKGQGKVLPVKLTARQ